MKRVVGIKADSARHRLLFVAVFANHHGVWSYNNQGQFHELLSVPGKFANGHLFLDSKDNIYYSTNIPSTLFRSSNGGKTWVNIPYHGDVFWSIADAGNGTLYATLWSYNHPEIWRSLDQGQTWNEWKNFSKIFPSEAHPYSSSTPNEFSMRHLHDIVVVNGNIYVGTGDVTRWGLVSRDGGNTWTKIWDEGFTAHILVPQKHELFLGGDVQHMYGIGIHKIGTTTTTIVWNPDATNWMAYSYSMAQKGNVYLAAFHLENNIQKHRPYGILVSINGTTWKSILTFFSDAPFTSLYIADGPSDIVYVSHNGILGEIHIKN